MKSALAAIHFQDQPLGIYSENYQKALTILSGTTRLEQDPSAPDGTGDLLQTQLKKARVNHDDIKWYCSH